MTRLGACLFSCANLKLVGVRTQMTKDTLNEMVESLAKQAEQAGNPQNAMHYSQAALNVAHAASTLQGMRLQARGAGLHTGKAPSPGK